MELSPFLYVAFIEKRNGMKIYRVDGSYVRANIDIEFTNFAQPLEINSKPKYIPDDEIWMDIEHHPDEYEFFLLHALTENALMKNGHEWEDAHDQAKRIEQVLRNKKRPPYKDPFVREYIMTKEGVPVNECDGRMVRDWLDIDFTEGGHSRVYHDWMPDKEIWIDNDLPDHEKVYVFNHEYNEYLLMGQGVPYDEAHYRSSSLELTQRQKDWFREHGNVQPQVR